MKTPLISFQGNSLKTIQHNKSYSKCLKVSFFLT